MKKLFVALIVLLGLSGSSMAQFQQGPSGTSYPTDLSYFSKATGTPGLQLNSFSSNYGQLFNNAGVESWSLGYNTSLTANGTKALTWDTTPAVTANAPFVMFKTAIGSANTLTGGVYASTTIPVSSSFETVIGTGSATAVILTSTPNISTTTVVNGIVGIADGTYLVISCTATAAGAGVIFQDEGTLTGSRLQLGAASRTVSTHDTLTLIFSAADSFWKEVAYGNN